MATKKIEVGLVYSAKVGGTFIPVRVEESLGHGRYQAVNVADGKMVTFATDAVRGSGQTPQDYAARKNVAAPAPPPAADVAPGSKKVPKAKPTAKAGKDAKKKQRKPSGLDAAAAVLAEAGGPLGAKEMVERMLAKGLWTTGGKTPAATIYAAIIREIAVKGDQARFRKTDRGKFILNK